MQRPNSLKNQGGTLKVSTNNSFGLLMDIRIIGIQPHGEGLIREIAKDARDILSIRALNHEHVGDSQKQKKVLRTLLQGVTIVPMDANRIFLQSADGDLLTQFFGTAYFPGLSFFRMDPHEIAFLEKKDFEESIRFSESLQCWTREGTMGRYVHCEGVGGGGGAGRGKGKPDREDAPPPETESPTKADKKPRCDNCRPLNTHPNGEGKPKITFDPGIKNNVNKKLADVVERVAKETGKDLNISSTARAGSRGSMHYNGEAVDINRIDGEHVRDGGDMTAIKALQDAFSREDAVTQNFGPERQDNTDPNTIERYIDEKQKVTHMDHIHVGTGATR